MPIIIPRDATANNAGIVGFQGESVKPIITPELARAVVLSVTVNDEEADPLMDSVVGFTEHVVVAGREEQLKFTFPAKSLTPDALKL
jgi:hypothetical protein